MCAANTFFTKPTDKPATLRPPGTKIETAITTTSHEQIDYWLIPRRWWPIVTDIEADARSWLQTDHYPLIISLKIRYVEKEGRMQERCTTYDDKIEGKCSTEINKLIRSRRADGKLSTYTDWTTAYDEVLNTLGKNEPTLWKEYISDAPRVLIDEKYELYIAPQTRKKRKSQRKTTNN